MCWVGELGAGVTLNLIVNSILNFVFKVTLMTHVLCSEVNELGELGDGVTINVIVKSTFSFFCKVT